MRRMPADRDQIVAAALACFAERGMRATSVSHVARRAGVSRATAYRLAGGKQDLAAAVARAEVARFGAELARAIDWRQPFADVARQTIGFALRWLNDHAALQRVLRTEPEQLVDLIVQRPGRSTLIELLVPGTSAALEPFRAELAAEPAQVAEWGIRVLFSMLLAPSSALEGLDQITEMLLAGALRRRGGD